MADPVFVASSKAHLYPFLLKLQSASEEECVKIIQELTSHPNTFVFGEILDLPCVQTLSSSTVNDKYYKLVHLFCYGTYVDYKENRAPYPSLNEEQIKKLKLLTIATFSENSRILGYEYLQNSLEIETIRELEDLIIEGIYLHAYKAKLNQEKKCVEIEFAIGRDVSPKGISQLFEILKSWSERCQQILTEIDVKMCDADRIFKYEKGLKIETEGMLDRQRQTSLSKVDSAKQSNDIEMADEGSQASSSL